MSEIIEALPQQAQSALFELVQHDGKISWPVFIRKFGDVRVMGAGKRDRERPDLHPISAAETLWYHGLIGKAFLNLPPEPQEYAYIPDEIMALLEIETPAPALPLGSPADPAESAYLIPASDHILDHACTLLAALRIESISISGLKFIRPNISPEILKNLLHAIHILDDQGHAHFQNHQNLSGKPPSRSLNFFNFGMDEKCSIQ